MEIFEIICEVFNEALYEILIYIFLSFLFFSILETYFNDKFIDFIAKTKSFQPIFGALIGIIPGCGALATLTTLYHKRKISFSTVIAALIATTGDVAFVLIAQSFSLFLKVIAITFTLGVVTGYIVEMLNIEQRFKLSLSSPKETGLPVHLLPNQLTSAFYYAMILACIGFLLPEGIIKTYLGVIITLFLILYRFTFKHHDIDEGCACKDIGEILYKTSIQVSHMAVWIVSTFLIYEVIFAFFINEEYLISLIANSGIFIVLVSTIIGMIPGCGVQILHTSLYLKGLIPFVGLITNMISQDGDGLVPLLAYDKKSALVATMVTTIPALLFGIVFVIVT